MVKNIKFNVMMVILLMVMDVIQDANKKKDGHVEVGHLVQDLYV